MHIILNLTAPFHSPYTEPHYKVRIMVHTVGSKHDHLVAILRRLPYGAKLSREKTFSNFAVLEPPAKVFFHKIWVDPYQPMIGFSILRKFSPQNGHFLPIHEEL